ncbi:MAG: hypothetical protein PHY20_14755, partial [Bacteroidales bacterium]|nr:hypothetical protein [Bacteroidales bacterium]
NRSCHIDDQTCSEKRISGFVCADGQLVYKRLHDQIGAFHQKWILFKECKQYLRLGTCQNTDFDGQIADTTIVLITHTILMLQRRFEAYETMGGLFRESQQQLLELTLWDRILKIFIRMLRELLEILSIDIEETIEKITSCDKSATQLLAMLEAIKQCSDNAEYNPETAA